MRYGIVVDSGCDLDTLRHVAQQDVLFSKVPLKIMVGDQEFNDEIGFDPAVMLEALDSYHGKTSTAAPGVGAWYAALEQSEVTFGLTITGTLSGSYASAEAARKMLGEEQPEKQIEILDTLSTGPEVSLMAEKLACYMQQGLAFSEISQRIRQYRQKTALLYVLQNVDNLVRNGRLNHLVGKAISVLNIRILGRASQEGRLEILQKCRGKEKAYERLTETMFHDGYAGGKVIISHCDNPDMAQLVYNCLAVRFPDASICVMKSKALNSYYAEKGGVLVGFELAGAELV